MSQLALHKKIDLLASQKTVPTADSLNSLISGNFDARDYFFAKAPTSWGYGLFEQGSLDALKEIPEDRTRFSFTMPELNYLERIAEDHPGHAVDIMRKIDSARGAFNPEVLDRFSRICAKLPAADLAVMVSEKIAPENWVQLMDGFDRWGFDYKSMLDTLAEAGDDENLLRLADTVLTVRVKEDRKQRTSFGDVAPFYLSDVSATGVFDHLEKLAETKPKPVSSLLSRILSEIVLLHGKDTERETPFACNDSFSLFDVDFFELEPGTKRRLSDRDDVREVAAVLAVTARKMFKDAVGNTEKVKEIYRQYFAGLPDSHSMYRLKAFVFSLCPDIFAKEIKTHLFRVFEENGINCYTGAEYKWLLRNCFGVLPDSVQRDFIKQMIAFFKSDESWRDPARKFFSFLSRHLTRGERVNIEGQFGELLDDVKPEPMISSGFASAVIPQAPETPEVWEMSVPEIVGHLKGDLSPVEIVKRDDHDRDFHHPVNAEGVGDRLKKEVEKRPNEFMEHAPLFFDRDNLDAHYTYAFLRVAYDLLKGGVFNDASVSPLIDLLNAIRVSGEHQVFEFLNPKERYGAWLSNWDGVHRAASDVVKQMLQDDGSGPIVDFDAHRDSLLHVIGYLLHHSDPVPERDKSKASKDDSSPEHANEIINDPFTTAINSVRGVAYEAFTLFVFHDGKRLQQDGKILAEDVKELYSEILRRENTQPLMFMFGRTIPTFYFRDMGWTRAQLDGIFPEDDAKHPLYLAAWEGYLSNSLYEELFHDKAFIALYERALALPMEEQSTKRHRRDLDEGLAVHLALAHMHYPDFGLDHDLFKKFWDIPNEKRHAAFVGFIGRKYLSGRNSDIDALMKEDANRAKVRDLWDWLLDRKLPVDVLENFGYWINVENEVFELPWLADRIKKTLEQSGGALDWDVGIQNAIGKLAEAAPENTLDVIRMYLLDYGLEAEMKQKFFFSRGDWSSAFEILYKKAPTREGVVQLINDLIAHLKGGRRFWGLKDVIKEAGK